jgi:hypothetical protein
MVQRSGKEESRLALTEPCPQQAALFLFVAVGTSETLGNKNPSADPAQAMHKIIG